MSSDKTAARCSTPCDDDCDAVCHEDHVPGHKKRHWPYDCPAAERYGWDGSDFIAVAVRRLRAERDKARADAVQQAKRNVDMVAAWKQGNNLRNRVEDAGDQHRQALLDDAMEQQTRAEKAEAERDEARARLAEIGKTHVEWGYGPRANDVTPTSSAVHAGEVARRRGEHTWTRIGSDWRKAEEGGERG